MSEEKEPLLTYPDAIIKLLNDTKKNHLNALDVLPQTEEVEKLRRELTDEENIEKVFDITKAILILSIQYLNEMKQKQKQVIEHVR